MSEAVLAGMVAPANADGKLEQIGWEIGVQTAGPAAEDVDRQARFPHETLQALRQERMLSALAPCELGGHGASLYELAGVVRALAAHCSSSALVLAMHSIEVVNLVRHGHTPELRALLAEVVADQLLIANANSEVGVGGDVGRSICAIEPSANGFCLDKQALAISYGQHADLVFATARRSPDAANSDQVLVACRSATLQLEPLSTWDTLGLRGTCSMGFRLIADIAPGEVFDVGFAAIANGGGGQVRQILLSAVWVGIAEAAAAKAHAFVRAAARRSIGTVPPSAVRLAELATDVHQARSLLVAAAVRFAELDRAGQLDNAGFVVELRSLKVATSTLAVKVANAALGVCGIAGYKRDTAYSLDRIIRDAHGGVIMVNNDRYLADNAQLLLARKQI